MSWLPMHQIAPATQAWVGGQPQQGGGVGDADPVGMEGTGTTTSRWVFGIQKFEGAWHPISALCTF